MAGHAIEPDRSRDARRQDLPDVPWWWRPPGHSVATPVVLGYLALAQSVPFLWWRRIPLLAAAALAIRTGLGHNPYSAAAATAVGAFGLGVAGDLHQHVPVPGQQCPVARRSAPGKPCPEDIRASRNT
jgi:hypothetical protein